MTSSLYLWNQEQKGGFQWWLSCIYGPSIYSNKNDIWIELNDLGNLIDNPWCVLGDFNEILYSSDRKGNTRIHTHCERFHNWVSDCSLMYLPLTNWRHEWSNFRANASGNKIGKIFVSKDWQELNPNLYLKGLPRPVSSQCPRLLVTEQRGLTPF